MTDLESVNSATSDNNQAIKLPPDATRAMNYIEQIKQTTPQVHQEFIALMDQFYEHQ